MSEEKLCYGCMTPSEDGICPHCGYDPQAAVPANYLKPGVTLHEGRYLVGRAMSVNSEGVTYIGYDQQVGLKCLIREYFPAQLCRRAAGSSAVDVGYELLAQYKALMAEYTEMHKALSRMRNLSHLNPALDLFAENNTTYAISEYLEGRTLLGYLKENAGELSWNTVRRILPPLFTTLSLLHNAGILHRGISDETIYVTELGELKLLGFCVSAVRTNESELTAELFDGYAAPEQYYADRQQGTWTDVYGICAVLYRILTGSRPMDALSRQDDEILAPSELNPLIPEKVSKVIMQGMALDCDARIRTITDLVTMLFEQEDEHSDDANKSKTAVYKAPAVAKTIPISRTADRQPQRTQRSTGGQQRQGTPQRQVASQQRPPQRSQQRPSQQRAPQRPPQRQQQQYRRPPQQQYRHRQQQEPGILEKARTPMLIMLLFVLIVAVIVWVFIQLININRPVDSLSSSTPESSVGNVIPAPSVETTVPNHPDGVVPSVVGKNFQYKKDEFAGWLNLEPEYEFNETFPKDTILWQEFEPETDFFTGSSMKVKVSLGTALVSIPEFKGQRLAAYLSGLKEMGFVEAVDGEANNRPGSSSTDDGEKKQKVLYKSKVDYNYSDGFVCAVEPRVGSVVNARDDYTIIVYYAYNPVFSTLSNASSTNDSSKTTKSTKTTTTTTKTTSKPTETDPPKTTPPTQTTPPATTPPTQTTPTTPNSPPPTSDPPTPEE